MTLRIPRTLPAAAVEVPRYVPTPGGPVPALVRGEGSVPFDPHGLDSAQRAAAQAPALGALLGLVAVPADMMPTSAAPEAAVRADIGGRTVTIRPLPVADTDGFRVCGVHGPVTNLR